MNETYLACAVLVVAASLSIAAAIFDPLKIKNKFIGFSVLLCRSVWDFAGALVLVAGSAWVISWAIEVVTK
jgi:hypothetical protein